RSQCSATNTATTSGISSAANLETGTRRELNSTNRPVHRLDAAMGTGHGALQDLIWVIWVTDMLLYWALPVHGAMWMLRRRSQSRFVRLKAAAIAMLGWVLLFALAFGLAMISYCEGRSCSTPRREVIGGLIFLGICGLAHYALYRTWRAPPSNGASSPEELRRRSDA